MTVIMADPLMSIGRALQLASDNEAIVKVVVVEGETFTVSGEVLPLNEAPFDNVPFQGPVPVTTMLILIDCPLQIVFARTIKPVGRGCTIKLVVMVLSQPFT